MFTSNQTKQRKYLKLRRAEEENAAEQQARLDEQIAKERGFETRVSNLSKLAKRVAGETFFEKNFKNEENFTYENFSKVVKRIVGLDPLTLSKKARIVWKDLNNPAFRSDLNEFMMEEADRLQTSGLTDDQINKKVFESVKAAVFGGDKKVEKEVLDLTLPKPDEQSIEAANLRATKRATDAATELAITEMSQRNKEKNFKKKEAQKLSKAKRDVEIAQMTTEDILSRATQKEANKKKPGAPKGQRKSKRVNLD